jgi:ABC-type transport system involved in multi-copper enzyme maturation permease subunit
METGSSRTWLIAKKEVIVNIRNFKIPVVFATMSMLLLLSARLLALDYQHRLNNWSVNQDQRRDPVVGGSVFFDLSDGGFFHRVGVGPSPPKQAPQPFSALVKGMDGEMDRTVSVSQRIVFGPRREESDISAILDTPDTSFVIKLLVSLFALMFSLDTVTREKEAGTLRAALSQPIRRRELILYKSIGVTISLLGPFAMAFASEIIYLHFAHGLVRTGEDLSRASLIFGLGALYGIVFVHIGLFISVITTRTKIATITALLTWAMLVLVLPNAAVFIAKLLTPTPSYNQLNARLYEARQRNFQPESKTNPMSSQLPEQPVSSQALLHLFEVERQLTDSYLTSKRDQNRRARLFAALTPAGALTFGLSDLASTGVDAYNSYLELFRSSRDVMLDALKRRIDLPPQEGNKLVQEASEIVDNRQRRAEPLESGLQSSALPFASLLAWAAFFGLMACWLFKRYDVR